MTAIAAAIKAGPNLRKMDQPHRKAENIYSKPISSSKKVLKKKILRILLDSGSSGDLMFHKKGAKKCSPYLDRQVPKSWCTSNRVFQTKGKASLEIIIFI